MSDPGQSRSGIVQGAVVLAVMLGGLVWLAVAALRSDSVWFKGVVGVFLGSILLWAALIGWLATCQWLDKRRCSLEGREWRP